MGLRESNRGPGQDSRPNGEHPRPSLPASSFGKSQIREFPPGSVPTGSAKTTLLAQFATCAAGSGWTETWHRSESAESDVDELLADQEKFVRKVIPILSGEGDDVAKTAAALEANPRSPSVLVVDDLEALADKRTEAAREQLIAYHLPILGCPSDLRPGCVGCTTSCAAVELTHAQASGAQVSDPRTVQVIVRVADGQPRGLHPKAGECKSESLCRLSGCEYNHRYHPRDRHLRRRPFVHCRSSRWNSRDAKRAWHGAPSGPARTRVHIGPLSVTVRAHLACKALGR